MKQRDSSASDKLSCRNSPAQLPAATALTEQVHCVSQLRDSYLNRWNYLVLQNWRLFHAPDKHEASLQDEISLSVCQNLTWILKSSKFGLMKNKTTNTHPNKNHQNPTKNQLLTEQSSMISGKYLELKDI